MGLFGSKQIIDTAVLKESLYPRVAYVGFEQGDLMIALANVALAAGLKVAILDNSLTHDIWNIMKSDEEEAVVDKGNLCIVKDAVLGGSNNGWDLVIEYIGANVSENNMPTAPLQILVTDSRRMNLDAIKKVLPTEYEKRMIVYRNTASSFSLNDLCHEIGFSADDKKKVYMVRYDRKEDESYAKFTRNITTRFMRNFNSVSLAFEEICRITFHREVEDATYISDSQLNKLIKKGGKLTL